MNQNERYYQRHSFYRNFNGNCYFHYFCNKYLHEHTNAHSQGSALGVAWALHLPGQYACCSFCANSRSIKRYCINTFKHLDRFNYYIIYNRAYPIRHIILCILNHMLYLRLVGIFYGYKSLRITLWPEGLL